MKDKTSIFKHSGAGTGFYRGFYGDCGKSLHASAVAAGSDRSRHGIRRTPAGFGIGAGVAAGEGKMRRM